MTLLMIFCTAHKAYTATDRNSWGGHGRGGKGASGHLEISHGSGPYGAADNKQEVKKSTTMQQLPRAFWRTDLNRTECTEGREHGAPGDNRFMRGGHPGDAHNEPEKSLSADTQETPTQPNKARRSRARNCRLAARDFPAHSQ